MRRDDAVGVAILCSVVLAGIGVAVKFQLWQEARAERAAEESKVIESTEELREILQAE